MQIKLNVGASALILTILLFTKFAAATSFEEAAAHYTSGNFEPAFKGFSELATLGNARAQFNLGVMYARGEFIKKDIAESYAWLKLAALSEEESELSLKTLKIIAGKLDNSAKRQAEQRFNSLAKKYSPKVIKDQLFPTLLSEDVALEKSGFTPAEAIRKKPPKYPENELRDGNIGWVDFYYSVAPDGTVRNVQLINAESKNFEKAAIKALRSYVYQPATMNGQAVAQHGMKLRFTFAIEGKRTFEKQLTKAVTASRERALHGGGLDKYRHAYSLSLIESASIGLKGNEHLFEPSIVWYSKAAQDGNPYAKFEIGRRLGYGHQCEVEGNKSHFWVESAVKDELADAQFLLGTQTYQGIHCDKDEAKGLALIKTAADKGFLPAVLEYSWLLATHPEASLRQPNIALEYLQKIELKNVLVRLRYFEIEAVVHAALGNFKQANTALKKAKKQRARYQLPGGTTEKISQAISAKRIYTH